MIDFDINQHGIRAAHSLTPGHGKAIVAAYLVGARSTPWHAFYLGLTVTITHTLGVFLLGLITLFASRYILADQLYPWLGVLSGIIITALAASMMVSRIRPYSRKKNMPIPTTTMDIIMQMTMAITNIPTIYRPELKDLP